MKYHLASFCTALAHLTWFATLVALLTGHLHLDWTLGSLLLSGFLAVFTFVRRHSLFKNFADPADRLQLRAALIAGPAFGLLALILGGIAPSGLVALIVLSLWVFLYLEYRENKDLFVQLKNGRVAQDAWLSVPAEAIGPGYLIFTSGVLGPRLGMSVDHGELALRTPEGDMVCLSSHWAKGVVINPLLRVTKGSVKNGPYFVARPVPELTEAQSRRLYEIALEMKKENEIWRDEETKHRTAIVNRLPLPKSLKEKLLKKILPDGYDWFGMAIGRRRKHSWTCIGACIEAYARLSKEEKKRGVRAVQLREYGVGLFGWGTGIADPIVPIRVMTDPALHLMNQHDRALFERSQQVPAPVSQATQ
jgi:hypothetical protein